MRLIFHRHYRPLLLFKSPLDPSLSSSNLKPTPLSPLAISNQPLSFCLSSLKSKPKGKILSLSPFSKFHSLSLEMAQKTEKEETEFKVPETLSLCINCGFTGNPATNNMCQNCFKSTTATTTTPSNTTSTTVTTSTSAILSPHKLAKLSRSSLIRSPERSNSPAKTRKDVASQDRRSDGGEAPPPAKREVNRCSGCRRKVGLTGFRCRCGDLFCAEHRYSDRHDCNFDYKTAGREVIARENPVVKAAKIVRV